MTRKEFDLIVDEVGERINPPCPETLKLLLWGKYQDWDALEFALLIRNDIENPRKINNHVNS